MQQLLAFVIILELLFNWGEQALLAEQAAHHALVVQVNLFLLKFPRNLSVCPHLLFLHFLDQATRHLRLSHLTQVHTVLRLMALRARTTPFDLFGLVGAGPRPHMLAVFVFVVLRTDTATDQSAATVGRLNHNIEGIDVVKLAVLSRLNRLNSTL